MLSTTFVVKIHKITVEAVSMFNTNVAVLHQCCRHGIKSATLDVIVNSDKEEEVKDQIHNKCEIPML